MLSKDILKLENFYINIETVLKLKLPNNFRKLKIKNLLEEELNI